MDLKFTVGTREMMLNVWISDRVSQFLLGFDWLSLQEVYYIVGKKFLTVGKEKTEVFVWEYGTCSRRIVSLETAEIPAETEVHEDSTDYRGSDED